LSTIPHYCTILANGKYPEHPIAHKSLARSDFIICCDGAIAALDSDGLTPHKIIGDMDSISPTMVEKYRDILIQDTDQDSNDLEKAIFYSLSQNISKIDIVGATGLREDHTIRNIFLLTKFGSQIKDIRLLTDFGVFQPISDEGTFTSFPGQQVSVFSPDPNLLIESVGLKYPLDKIPLTEIHSGTLNESISDKFSISAPNGVVIVFTTYKGKS